MITPPKTSGNRSVMRAEAPAGRMDRPVVIHGVARTTSNIFSDMAPIAERTSIGAQPKTPSQTEADIAPIDVEARSDESVLDAQSVGENAEHLESVEVVGPLTQWQPAASTDIELAEQLVVDGPQLDEKPPGARPTSILAAHLLTCEYCGASVSKLRTSDMQIGAAMSQWVSCPTCSSARRISSLLIRPDRDDGLWFLPLQYLFLEVRGRRTRNRKVLFVDCSPVGSFVPLGQRIFREATVLSDVSRVKGRKYDVVEVPFLLETGLGLRQWLTAVNSNLGEHSVVHLVTLRRPHFSKPNSTEGWAGARLENLVQFPSIRGLETLIERSGLRIVKMRPKVVAPLNVRTAERLASASGLERCWLLLLVCWATLIHTIRSGRAYQLSIKRVRNAPGISAKELKENGSVAQ